MGVAVSAVTANTSVILRPVLAVSYFRFGGMLVTLNPPTLPCVAQCVTVPEALSAWAPGAPTRASKSGAINTALTVRRSERGHAR